MLAPLYKNRPIQSIESLSAALSISSDEIIEVAAEAETLIRPGKLIKKKNGTPRQTYKAVGSLELLHRKLVLQIFRKVAYPQFLQGSLPNGQHKRGALENARLHQYSTSYISVDVKSFFPSVSADQVRLVFTNVLHFSDEVANTLTAVCAPRAQLLQGLATSSYIANLVMSKTEAIIVKKLNLKGLTYSRYVDDIVVSGKRAMTHTEAAEVTSTLIGHLGQYGFKIARHKTQVRLSGSSPVMTGYRIHAGRVIKPRNYAREIRAQINNLESSELAKGEPKIRGKIAHLRTTNPVKADKLENQLHEAINELSDRR